MKHHRRQQIRKLTAHRACARMLSGTHVASPLSSSAARVKRRTGVSIAQPPRVGSGALRPVRKGLPAEFQRRERHAAHQDQTEAENKA